MNILSIESSFDVCGTSLVVNDKHLETIERKESKVHSKLLAVYVNDILQNNKITIKDIDCIAVSVGPGSYTGLRIGISLAKGLALPYDKSIYPISSFEIAKFQINKHSNFSVAYHSHRDFVYHCYFENSSMASKPEICHLEEITAKNIYGYNLDLISKETIYNEIKPSSKALSEYVLENKKSKFTAINKISPIYLSLTDGI